MRHQVSPFHNPVSLPIRHVRPRRRLAVRTVVEVLDEGSKEPAFLLIEQAYVVPVIRLARDGLLLVSLLDDPETGLGRVGAEDAGTCRRVLSQADIAVVQTAEVFQMISDIYQFCRPRVASRDLFSRPRIFSRFIE